MSGPAEGPGLGAYARAIERALGRLRGRPVVLSPKDWELVTDWHQRGVPAGLVLEVAEEASARTGGGGGGPPRTLAYLAPAVEEAFRVVADGRRRNVIAPSGAPTAAIEAVWRRVAEESLLPRLGGVLRDLLDRREAGESASAVDDALDLALPGLAPADLLSAVEADVERALEPYRGRLDAGAFEKSRNRAVLERLRRHLGLPRLVFALDVPESTASE